MLQTRHLMRSVALRCFCIGIFSAVCASLARADDGGQFYGLLRGRDLTPFGFLRLDMRPAHAIAIQRGSFAIAAELGYQNTWALSPEVERYLTEHEADGRHELGPADAQAIRELPGENYLLDLESAVIDLTVHYKFAENMSAYVIVNAITYGGGFLDSTIESFHDAFGPDAPTTDCRSRFSGAAFVTHSMRMSRLSTTPAANTRRHRKLSSFRRFFLDPNIK